MAEVDSNTTSFLNQVKNSKTEHVAVMDKNQNSNIGEEFKSQNVQKSSNSQTTKDNETIERNEDQSANLVHSGEISEDGKKLIDAFDTHVRYVDSSIKSLVSIEKKKTERNQRFIDSQTSSLKKLSDKKPVIDLTKKDDPEEKGFVDKIKENVSNLCGIARNMLFGTTSKLLTVGGVTITPPVVAGVGALAVGIGASVYMANKLSGANYKDVPENVAKAIQNASKLTGVPETTLLSISYYESGFDPKVRNKHGTATGLFQFIGPTWKGMVQKYGKQYGLTLDGVTDPYQNALAGALYMRDNGKILSKMGFNATDPTNLYIMHWLGGGDGPKFFRALKNNPDTPADSIQWAGGVISGNRAYWYTNGGKGRIRTIREVYNHLNGLMGNASKKFSPILNETLMADSMNGMAGSTYTNEDNGVMSNPSSWTTPLHPNKSGKIVLTAPFGKKRSTGAHQGVDLRASEGTPIIAVSDGVIEYSDYDRKGRGGETIGLRSGDFYIGYAHLSKRFFGKGQTVKKGEVIGLTGNTGWSRHPHLHLGVSKGRGKGRNWVNPINVIVNLRKVIRNKNG